MFISVTKLRLKNIWQLGKFFSKAMPSILQARKAPGNLFLKTRGFLLVQCTLTGWESEEAMRSYRDSGAHLEAMKVSRSVTVFLQSTHFESPVRPTWKEALERMERDPRSIKFDLRPS